GRVVHEHRDVTRRARGQPFEEQRREPARLREVLGVGPLPITELDRDEVAELLVVPAQQRGRVLGDERRLAGSGNRSRIKVGRRKRGHRTPNVTGKSLFQPTRYGPEPWSSSPPG